GIRDFHVTGVQTCALPISEFMIALFGCFYAGVVAIPVAPPLAAAPGPGCAWFETLVEDARPRAVVWSAAVADPLAQVWSRVGDRSEERRVGEERRARWSAA